MMRVKCREGASERECVCVRESEAEVHFPRALNRLLRRNTFPKMQLIRRDASCAS